MQVHIPIVSCSVSSSRRAVSSRVEGVMSRGAPCEWSLGKITRGSGGCDRLT